MICREMEKPGRPVYLVRITAIYIRNIFVKCLVRLVERRETSGKPGYLVRNTVIKCLVRLVERRKISGKPGYLARITAIYIRNTIILVERWMYIS